MRLQICAVGRLRSGPEQELVEDYIGRFNKTGRSLGLGPVKISEVENKKGGGIVAEAALLQNICTSGSLICTLDERGTVMTSPEFAKLLGKWRDQGRGNISFLIGGADGLDPSLRSHADFSLSFGKMVWPHMLVRVILAEQLYRAASILSNAPYHRS